MGIEPTPRAERDTGFEDQEGHQTPNASKSGFHLDPPLGRTDHCADHGGGVIALGQGA
jgi:hypothetical protein